jgi:hypothetical protein
MPYLRGDSLWTIWFAATVLHRRFIDQNTQADAHGVVWVMHWARIVLNGYRWYWTGERDADGREVRRRVPRAWQIQNLSTAQVSHLRTRRRGGKRPHSALTHMRRMAKYNRVWCLEGKGTMRHAVSFSYLANCARLTGCLVVFMTLQSIPGWRNRLRKAHAAGFPCALLPRGPKPDDWHEFEAMGVQVWGRWR